jgi:rhodanese-related sulfurtransferase
VETARRILILLGIAGLLAVTANAVSPRGLSWKEPIGKGLAAQVSAAGLFPVSLISIPGLIETRSVLFVDARPRDEYNTGHLRGALWSGPGGALPPRDRPIVVYCANEFCESSLRLAEQLKKAGCTNVGVFIEGYDAWWNAGGSVEQE